MIRGTYYGLRIKNVHWRLVCTISTIYMEWPKTQSHYPLLCLVK